MSRLVTLVSQPYSRFQVKEDGKQQYYGAGETIYLIDGTSKIASGGEEKWVEGGQTVWVYDPDTTGRDRMPRKLSKADASHLPKEGALYEVRYGTRSRGGQQVQYVQSAMYLEEVDLSFMPEPVSLVRQAK